MKSVVVRNIRRASEDTVAALANAGVATVHEAMGRVGPMKPCMRPIYAGAAIAGSAVTVLTTPGDNWMIHVGVEQCRSGDVMVVAVTADNTDGMVGELIATSLRARGVKGVVIDVGCRDVRALSEMAFPVWSRASGERGQGARALRGWRAYDRHQQHAAGSRAPRPTLRGYARPSRFMNDKGRLI